MDERKKYTVLTNYYRPKPGGFCKRYFRAINALLDRGHTVHYLAVIEYPIKHRNCHFHRFPWPQGYTENLLFWAVLHLLSPLLLLFIAVKYKITHAFAFHPTYSLFLQPARYFSKVPLVIFYRADHIISHEIKSRPAWLVRLDMILESYTVRNTKLYCVSDTLANTVMERTNLLKGITIETFPNNIDKIEVVHAQDKIFHLACIGLIEKIKNHELIIRTVKDLKNENITLDIYGNGPLLDYLIKLTVELGISNIVKFHGWVQPEYIWPNIDLLLMPSLREGAPNAMLECIGAGIPVLASNIPELRGLLPEQQLLSNSDSTEWIRMIRYVLQNRDNLPGEMVINQNHLTQKLVFDWDEGVTRRILEQQV